MTPLGPLHPVIMAVPAGDRRLVARQRVVLLSRLARLAAIRSGECSGLPLDRFPKDSHGVPLPLNGIYWSLSHKAEVVGGVVAPVPVGIDLETVRPIRQGMLAKVADGQEWRLIQGDPQRAFFRFWTAKEAVLKAVGQGMAALSRCRVVAIADDTRMVVGYDTTRWSVAHLWFGNHVAAVTAHDLEVCWRLAADLEP